MVIKKEKYLEKAFREYEERYCEKHGRNKFLKHLPRMFALYLISSAFIFLFTIVILIIGIICMNGNRIIAGVIILIAMIAMVLTILPPYRRLAKKCKKERELETVKDEEQKNEESEEEFEKRLDKILAEGE